MELAVRRKPNEDNTLSTVANSGLPPVPAIDRGFPVRGRYLSRLEFMRCVLASLPSTSTTAPKSLSASALLRMVAKSSEGASIELRYGRGVGGPVYLAVGQCRFRDRCGCSCFEGNGVLYRVGRRHYVGSYRPAQRWLAQPRRLLEPTPSASRPVFRGSCIAGPASILRALPARARRGALRRCTGPEIPPMTFGLDVDRTLFRDVEQHDNLAGSHQA